jgi:hypothetical protein
MPWLYFVLSAACFAIAFRTLSLGIAAICLLLAFGLMLAGALALASARIQSRSQSASALLGPAQAAAMQRRREQGPPLDATAAAADRSDASVAPPAIVPADDTGDGPASDAPR